MWLRGFFATDVWASHNYSPESRVLDSRTIESSAGWLFTVRSSTLLPAGTVPQSVHPMDSRWVHEAGPADVAGTLPPGADRSLVFSHSSTSGATAAAPATPRSFQVLHYSTFGVRWVLLTALASGLPVVWIVLHLRSRRARNSGVCARCSYDLRASPERCPECGTLPEEKR